MKNSDVPIIRKQTRALTKRLSELQAKKRKTNDDKESIKELEMEITKNNKWLAPRKMIKSKPLATKKPAKRGSKEHRAKISAAMRAHWASPAGHKHRKALAGKGKKTINKPSTKKSSVPAKKKASPKVKAEAKAITNRWSSLKRKENTERAKKRKVSKPRQIKGK